MKHLILTTLICLGSLLNAQTIIKPKLIQAGSGNCDNTVVISGMNIPAGAEIIRRHYFGGSLSQTLISIDDTLTDFCAGYNGQGDYDEIAVTLSPVDTICLARMVNDQTDFQVTEFTPPSSDLAEDGTLSLTFNSGLSLQYMSANNAFGQTYLIYTSDNQTFNITGIAAGIVSIYYENPADSLVFMNVIHVEPFSGSVVNNQLSISRTLSEDDGSCNGSVEYDLNGTGPYTFEWMTGAVTSNLLTDTLCAGSYTVLITDQGTSENVLDHFIIVDTGAVFYDPTLQYYTPEDTLSYLFVNCGINYTLPVDSITYAESYISGPPDSSTYVFYISVYQNGNSATITDSMVIIDSVNYLFDLGVYCDYFKSAEFTGKRLYVARSPGEESTLGLSALSAQNAHYRVYPVPSRTSVTIDGPSKSGTIYSAIGQYIGKYSQGIIYLDNLRDGVYFAIPDGSERTLRFVVRH